MSDPGGDPSLDRLGARLRAARDQRDRANGRGPEQGKGGYPSSGLGFGLRMGVELVAGLAIGVGIGFLLDRWLDTGPWFLVVFFFMGAAAGFLNVYRLARGYGSAVGFAKSDAGGQDKTNDGG